MLIEYIKYYKKKKLDIFPKNLVFIITDKN